MMSFLVPKPIERPIRTKPKSNYDKSTIFDKIRNLSRVPNPVIETIDEIDFEREFVSSIFADIRELCRRPQLLKDIDQQLAEDAELEAKQTVSETTVYQKKKIEVYSDSNDSNSFDIISKTKIFQTLVKKRINQRVDQSVNTSSDENSVKTNEKINSKRKNVNKSPKKRSTVKSSKNDSNYVRGRKPLLSIDCDITSKISEYSKQYSKPNKKTNNRKTAKKSDQNKISQTINTSVESADSGNCSSYDSMASPMSTSVGMSYSMPATPSTDSMSSAFSCETSSSVLSQIRKSLNPKFETYRQYLQRCAHKELKNKISKRSAKEGLHFTEKVLQWSDKLCSGNATPVHNIEYFVTPPGSPQKANESNIDANDELTAIIDSLQNLESDNLYEDQFNELLEDLFSSETNTS